MLACSDRGFSLVITATFRGATLAALLVASHAAAQNFPVKSIRYIVPQAPGGSSDTLARVIAPRLAEFLNQQVVSCST
jgi:tripartite-type tricarboxylate transporter receptor subunit TctC